MKRTIVSSAIIIGMSLTSVSAQSEGDNMTEHSGSKKIIKYIEVAASASDVWKAWTTSEGLSTFFGVQHKIELKVGGAFEIYFSMEEPEGSRGSEGCQILAMEPERLLMFSWNAPPQLPDVRNSGDHTWVILELEDLGNNKTGVSLTNLGYKTGGQWDESYDYFNSAWGRVLEGLRRSFLEQ